MTGQLLLPLLQVKLQLGVLCCYNKFSADLCHSNVHMIIILRFHCI